MDQQGSGLANLPSIETDDQSWHNRTALVESPRYVRAPWRHSVGPDMVEVSFDMPGFLYENIKAGIRDDILLLYGRETDADNFVKIASYQLPVNTEKCGAEAVLLKHGVLTIYVPRKTVDFTPHVLPIRTRI